MVPKIMVECESVIQSIMVADDTLLVIMSVAMAVLGFMAGSLDSPVSRYLRGI